MKKYTKVQMMAKNAPTGSYAAGCPVNYRDGIGCPKCIDCERAR